MSKAGIQFIRKRGERNKKKRDFDRREATHAAILALVQTKRVIIFIFIIKKCIIKIKTKIRILYFLRLELVSKKLFIKFC